MYITADGDEYVHEIVVGHGDEATGAEFDAGTSVGSTDVLKAGQIYTETPEGRMRLMDYFNNVEKKIADEITNRKADIAAVRAQMARDFAFNAAARAKLKKDMLTKMAVNAKIARDNLDREMRKTQEHFAKNAEFNNRRYKASLKRDKQTKKLIGQDKRRAAKQLKLAVTSWQKNTNAWASATNARIDQMNTHVAANAAQIKENAKKARKDLEVTMHEWDYKVATFRTESSTARNKLSEQFKAQDKATRAWANNKIKGMVASTSAQFNDVQTHMAKNRHEIDMQLKKATMRFEAALNAAKALEDKRYAESVANIQAAKEEAKAKVDAASAEFKIGLMTLSSTVSEQVAKVNKNIDATAGQVRSDAAEQAKVNANVNAEMTRMVKLGNKRYVEHLKDDAELQNLISKDKSETDDKLNKMAESFNSALASVRKQLAADRKHSEDELKKSTSAVWAKLQANQAEQAKKNAEMAAATRRMRLDAMDAVREAKAAFRKKIADLGEIVAENDKKADAKIKHLTGVVGEEAEKSRQGREELAALEDSNKKELKKAINDAIATGEKRAKEVEAKGEKMDADTKWLVENKLNAEITKLRDETNASVETLALMNKEARDQMKAEMLYAIRTAAEVAKADLDIAVRDGVKKMIAFQAKSAEVHSSAEAGRADLKTEIAANAKQIAAEIQGAVAADAAAQKALGDETAKALEKTNKDITAYSDQMRAIALKTRADIKATNEKTLAAIKEEEERANGAIENFTAEDAARQEESRKFMEDELAIAAAATEKKFGDAYAHLADNRGEAEEAMATAFEGLNDSLAKQAALADSRFEKTVKDIAAARKQAADQVADFRKQFAAELSVTREMIRATEAKLEYNVMKVAAEVKTLKQEQASVNAKVEEGLIHIEELSNKRFSENKAARGVLRKLMDDNKAAAAAETAALKTHLEGELQKARKVNHDNRIEMAKDLTEATEKFQEALGAQAKAQQAATDTLNEEVSAATVASANALAHAKTAFDSKITMLTDTVVAHAKEAEEEFSRVTGVVEDYAEASELDRTLIKEETKGMEAELNHALDRAISIGEAKAKAVAQRIAEHLKDTKRYIQVELNDQVEAAADNVLKIVEGKRQVLADNYLSLKAYAVAAADDITDYVVKGKGRGLSSIGDLLSSVGLMGAVHAPERQGLGMGGDALPSIFSGDSIKVSGSVAAINGLVNEYTTICGQVRERWPMGLGKYLLSKLEESMTDKGVLQVDKVEGKPGNFVFINGRSVGLSNKLSDFSTLAAKMTMYESVLAKMTSKITAPEPQFEQAPFMVQPDTFGGHAWEGA
jgi:hypothetical protein